MNPAGHRWIADSSKLEALAFTFFAPTEAGWNSQDDRFIQCLVRDGGRSLPAWGRRAGAGAGGRLSAACVSAERPRH